MEYQRSNVKRDVNLHLILIEKIAIWHRKDDGYIKMPCERRYKVMGLEYLVTQKTMFFYCPLPLGKLQSK